MTSESVSDLSYADTLWKSADALLGQVDEFAVKYPRMVAEVEECFVEGERLMAAVRERLRVVEDGK